MLLAAGYDDAADLAAGPSQKRRQHGWDQAVAAVAAAGRAPPKTRPWRPESTR